ncbi:MAG: hypothetical protein EA351_02585 [Gemmatimonadales bacterium]|nr:MAG: hypothetical protein EA351_02585 [Gemmatimonadales bacterium]
MFLQPFLRFGRFGEWVRRLLPVLNILPAVPLPPVRALLTIIPIASFLWAGLSGILEGDENPAANLNGDESAPVVEPCADASDDCGEIAYRFNIAEFSFDAYF